MARGGGRTDVSKFPPVSYRTLAFWIGFAPQDWDLGLGTRIWASKLGGGMDGGGGGEGENSPYV